MIPFPTAELEPIQMSMLTCIKLKVPFLCTTTAVLGAFSVTNLLSKFSADMLVLIYCRPLHSNLNAGAYVLLIHTKREKVGAEPAGIPDHKPLTF